MDKERAMAIKENERPFNTNPIEEVKHLNETLATFERQTTLFAMAGTFDIDEESAGLNTTGMVYGSTFALVELMVRNMEQDEGIRKVVLAAAEQYKAEAMENNIGATIDKLANLIANDKDAPADLKAMAEKLKEKC